MATIYRSIEEIKKDLDNGAGGDKEILSYHSLLTEEFKKALKLVGEIKRIAFISSESEDEMGPLMDTLLDIIIRDEKPIYVAESHPILEENFYLYKVKDSYVDMWVLDFPIAGMGSKLVVNY